MCFVRISEQTATFALLNINRLVFITEVKSVYSAVRTECLYKTDTLRLKRLIRDVNKISLLFSTFFDLERIGTKDAHKNFSVIVSFKEIGAVIDTLYLAMKMKFYPYFPHLPSHLREIR
jgi:hypothetical protein